MRSTTWQLAATSLALSLSACAEMGDSFDRYKPPRQIGDDMYIISIESTSMGVATKKVTLYDRAAAHCKELGKRMERVAANQNPGGMVGDYVLDLEYKCVK